VPLPSRSANSWLPQYIALGITWGCSFIFIKLGLEFLTPVGVAFGGAALGALTLVTFARLRNIALPRELKTWAHLTFPAMTLNVIPGYLFPVAEQDVTSILAGIINAVTPLMTLIAMMLVFRSEKVTKAQLLGLLLGFLGVLTLLGAWQGLGDNPLPAILALLFSVTCYGLSFPYSRKFVLPLGLRPEAAAATQLVIASAILLPFYLIDGGISGDASLVPILAMVGLGIFGRGFAYIWNFQIMAAAGSAIASSVTYVTPVVAVIVGIIFLGEGVTWYEPVGGAIVLLGAAIAQGRIKLNRS
jgi:drug/metabolite transporter (DMT)-like permease